MTDAATPQWADLMQLAVTTGLFDVHTSMPGQVIRVLVDDQSQRQFVDVQPCLRRALVTDDDNAQPFVEEDLPVLPRVPVGFMQAGGFFVSLPIAVGDFVTLIFAERSIDRWIATAKKSQQATISTGDLGTHTLDGAIALPCGPAPLVELLTGVDANDLVIGGPAGIALRVSPSGQVRVAEGTDDVGLAGLIATELNRLKSDIATLKSAISTALLNINVAAGSAFAGTAVQGPFNTATSAVPSSPASVAASNVKAR